MTRNTKKNRLRAIQVQYSAIYKGKIKTAICNLHEVCKSQVFFLIVKAKKRSFLENILNILIPCTVG